MYSEWDQQYRSEPRDFGSIGLFFAGAAMGAGLMFLLDPRGGKRRRALIRDKVMRGSRLARLYGEKLGRHAASEARGGIEERKAHLRERDAIIPNEVLSERVRAQLGHVVSHPGSIDVIAENGVVTLRGPVLRGEIRRICDRLDDTRGVRNYNLELREHDSSQSIPGLHGVSRGQRDSRFAS
jgi:hypothetical protein